MYRSMIRNRHVVVVEDENSEVNFALGENRIYRSLPTPNGGLFVKLLYTTLDPLQKACMNDAQLYNQYFRPQIGRTVVAVGIGRVLESRHSSFSQGDLITGRMHVSEYVIILPENIGTIVLIDNPHDFCPTVFLDVLGLTGLTAYGSLCRLQELRGSGLRRGEVILISAAAGAIGHVAGQFAKVMGLTVIGAVDTDAKLDYILNDLKFHAGFNFMSVHPGDALDCFAPEGIDIFLDTAGGENLEAAMANIKPHGQIICCGVIPDYTASPSDRYGVQTMMNIVSKEITVAGYMVSDYPETRREKYHSCISQISGWLARQLIQSTTKIYTGIEVGPGAFLAMADAFDCGNVLLRLADDDDSEVCDVNARESGLYGSTGFNGLNGSTGLNGKVCSSDFEDDPWYGW